MSHYDRPQGHPAEESHLPGQSLTALIEGVVVLLRKPVSGGSLIRAITFAGFGAIATAHSDASAIAIGTLGSTALIVTLIASIKKLL